MVNIDRGMLPYNICKLGSLQNSKALLPNWTVAHTPFCPEDLCNFAWI
jgi:hypothetical protein